MFAPKYLYLVAALSLLGCGKGEIGEECAHPGSEADCVQGAVCTNDWKGNFCRTICSDMTPECPTGFTCNGISGTTLKSCQPDKPK